MPVPWQRGIVLLEKGAALALYPPYYRPLERPYLRYSEPLLSEQTAVFCNAASAHGHSLKNWPDDYAGLRIGINAGFLSGGARFDAAVREGRLSVHPAHGSRSNVLKLLRGRIDCYINDRLSIQWELRHARDSGALGDAFQAPAETTVVGTEQGFLGYTDLAPAQFPYRKDFIDKFNGAIRAMRAAGEIDSIATHFLDP